MEEWFFLPLVVALAYLVGSVPVAYLIARRLKGIDIRAVGSGNVGTVNTFRHVGVGAGMAVLVADALKGVLAALAPGWLGAPDWMAYAAVGAVVTGHIWPVFLRFHGGKGVASVLGVSLAVVPVLAALALLPTLLVGWWARSPVPGIAAGIVALNILTVATGQPVAQVILCLLLSVLVVGAHCGATWRRQLAALRKRSWAALLSIE